MEYTSQIGRVNGDVMTQAHEPLNIMDGTQANYSTKTKRGIYLSKCLAFIILVIFALALVTASLLVYNYAACPKIDQLANVTKYELCHCDQSKLLVLPLTTESSRSVIPLESSTHSSMPNITNLWLPKHVKPERYFLNITPYIYEGNFTFDGEVTIHLAVVEETKELTFHGVELTIHEIKIHEKDDDHLIYIVRQLEDVPRNFHILTLGSSLEVGKQYILSIKYTGILNDNLHGFYRSSYEEKGVKKWIAVTQFQAMDARRAFPCWDEPALKARFTISIARPNNMTSLSNMNIVRQSPHESLPDYTWDHYAESLPMSTYLVAFTVTDFKNMTNNKFSVWARSEAVQSAAFALEIGPKILKYLEEYYKIKFPLPKIDMIALPDFKNGAMENWGLLTFREISMLYEEGVSASTDRVHVATVVAHEIAHQWFGNLVTPTWWRDLWLNEGFATYVEYVAVNAVEKSWNITELCVLDIVHNVFQLDALNSSHQLSVEVSASEEADAIFDKISYGKGSALLRMLNHVLKSDVFNAGVTNYLNSKMYGNAEQRDLWSALTSAARKTGDFDADVAVVMDSWTLQTGFPVLTVTRNYENGSLFFKQERFVLINDTFEAQKSPIWWIPVSYTTASEKDFETTQPKLWLKGEKSLTVHNITMKPEDWFIANVQQTGFYRVNYDLQNWKLLIKILKDPARFQEIHIINRAQLVDDAMNLALTGRLDYRTALDVTSYLAHERSYVPWKAGLSALGYIDTMLSKGAHYLEYGHYVLRLLNDAVKEVGWEVSPNESVITSQYRVDLLASACHFEHPDCLENAVRMYTNWMLAPNPDSNNEIHVDLRGIVYCVGVRAGGVREWTFAWDRFKVATAPSERHRLLSVLGCTRSPSLLHRYLEMSLRNDSGIRKQDIVRVFSAVAGTGIGQPIAFNYIRANWQRLRSFVGSLSTINLIVKLVTRRLNQAHEYEELKRFVMESCSDLGRPVQQVLETISSNVQWRDRNYHTIVDWLRAADQAAKLN
ncbi:aminopeptidase N isoform X1 [Spodoptera frugiperda]|uniref:Aminopeptidase N n=2 Tax=Spodoptera frugiperda TaxID=7108 RepID=A0A9R0EBQ0_SPOFR|nr:aminopeptidase N isoform X1 [Spodoptera frugiperda]